MCSWKEVSSCKNSDYFNDNIPILEIKLSHIPTCDIFLPLNTHFNLILTTDAIGNYLNGFCGLSFVGDKRRGMEISVVSKCF